MLKSLASRVSFWHRALFVWPVPRDARGRGAGTHAMTTVLDLPLDPTSARSRSPARGPRPLPLACRLCGAPQPAAAAATCEECLGPLEPVYDPGRPLPDAATIAARAAVALALPRVAAVRGRAGRLARQRIHAAGRSARARPSARRGARLGQERRRLPSRRSASRTASSPSALNAALGARPRHGGLRLDRQPGQRGRGPGRARRPPGLDLHSRTISSSARSSGTAVYGPRLVRVRGTYDDVNRLCAQVADRFGWGLVNINLRGLLRRRLEDHGVRDRRAARLAARRRRSWRRWRAARC